MAAAAAAIIVAAESNGARSQIVLTVCAARYDSSVTGQLDRLQDDTRDG